MRAAASNSQCFLGTAQYLTGRDLVVQDTALVLSRFNSIILARVYAHKDVQELAELSSVPGEY